MRIKSINRFEFKYLLTYTQYQQLIQELPTFMQLDPHGANQSYPITSLYYDTAGYKAYWDKLEGLRFRRKIRIRAYGQQPLTPETPCFVEIKQHLNKTISKKRVILPYMAATRLCETGEEVASRSEAERAVIEEIQYLSHTWQLQPACVVSYDRLAFNGSDYDPSLRVTFDTNLKCRGHDLTLLSSSYPDNHYFLPPDLCIMEVKVNYRVPYWLIQLIGKYRCTRRRISKYCAALEQSGLLLKYGRVVGEPVGSSVGNVISKQ